MKVKLYSILIFSIFNFACQKQEAQLQNSPPKKEEIAVKTSASPTPEFVLDKNKEISIEESFVDKDLLQIGEYRIKKVKVEKREDGESSEITDAILTKNGKQVAGFEGGFYPLGNLLDFGLFSFFGNQEKQLIIVDTSNRYERDWILDLSPDYKLLFDSADYAIFQGYLARIDFDDDGVYEIVLNKKSAAGFSFPNASIPNIRVIFKYDKKAGRFLPANHKLPEYSLKKISEDIKRLNESKEKHFSDTLEIMFAYFYAGKENEAWRFFDENYISEDWMLDKIEDKQETKKKIETALSKDPIYKFIKRDLK